MKNFMDTRVKELMAMGATFAEAHAAALAEWTAEKNKTREERDREYRERSRKGTGKAAPAKELVEFVKADGSKVMVTPAQAAAWSKWRDGAPERKAKLDEVKAEYEAKHAAFKASDELIAALKAKPLMTRKEAKAYGFVGTKDEFKALKLEHKVYDKK